MKMNGAGLSNPNIQKLLGICLSIGNRRITGELNEQRIY